MNSTTGTAISDYIAWLENEIDKKDYGEVSIRFKIHEGQVVDVRKESVDTDHFSLEKKRE